MRNDNPYENRREAGMALVDKLKPYASELPVVVGLPRGGVVVAAIVARAMKADLDVIIAGKLRAPYNPELAIGAITEDGRVYLNALAIRGLHVKPDYLEKEKKARLSAITERLALYRKIRKKVPLSGRTVIIADDGLATGATMISAIQAASAEGAARIIVAVPGGPEDSVELIRGMKEVSEVVCPVIPPLFFAVSQLYADFRQIEDEEVIEILKEFADGPG
ncbi:MAG: phosphoribosyltransferase [Deltaproteobacteria bacterium]|nr:phosphoribosyltransferase [Deltaproteobacteria bacterium]